ncbi:ABC transporter substrate-binding protein [Lihuaxuella thermophila]|uniref:Multiple sugar transport system substrate-binding protein n=1 Tax=Lihuaxuella thermophila TaxID=1173111 RepID=A0A1H8AK21_9BACL|nr:ABC transporter substrate-binding protein [Lihuaxuella thermophila]SEM70344.1 multiple sugar transport system substrate-binding protein [Lihuaxuella thermophila]
MKKLARWVAICLSSLFVLTACSSGTEKSGDGITIQYWHTQTEEERVAVLKQLIKEFEAENPGIHVEQVPVPEEDFASKIPAALGANRLPAIIEGGISNMLFLGSEEASDTVMHEEIIRQLGMDDFFTGALEKLKKPDGKGYYGVPINGWVQGIWYNKTLFKEKGLEPPETWENILKAAKAFHDPKHKRYGIVIGTAKDDFTEQTFSQFALSNQAAIFDTNGKVRFNTPEMVETLRYYQELAKYTPPGAESWREARELYLSGRAPMVMYSSYIMGDLAENDQLVKETGFAIPTRKQKATFGEITSLSIANTISKPEREAAKKFVLFLMQKENYIRYLHMSPGGANPTRKSIAKDPAYLNNEVLKKYGDTAVAIASGLETLQKFGFQDGKVYPQMGDISAQFIIGEAIYNMTEHNKKPEAVAGTAQQKMKETAEE